MWIIPEHRPMSSPVYRILPDARLQGFSVAWLPVAWTFVVPPVQPGGAQVHCQGAPVKKWELQARFGGQLLRHCFKEAANSALPGDGEGDVENWQELETESEDEDEEEEEEWDTLGELVQLPRSGPAQPVVDEVMEKRPKYTDVMTSLCVRSMAGDTILEMQIGSWHVLSLPMKYFICGRLRMRDGEYDLLFENHILGLDEKLGKLISEIPEHGIELMLVRNLRPDEDHPMDHWPNDEYEDHEIDQVMRRVQLLRGGATGAPRSPRSMRHAWRNTPQLTQVANAD